MGVYGVRPGGEVFKITDETGRDWTKLNDNSRVRMADDLDIAPDGKIYFSDCTTRYEASNYPLEIVEGRPERARAMLRSSHRKDAENHQELLLSQRRLRRA